jgi:hypothetical protein
VLPRAGRLLIFTSGPESPHQVRRVGNGSRVTFSMWFTCDREREFATFLDGRAHLHFAKAGRGGSGMSGSGDGGSGGGQQAGVDDEAGAADDDGSSGQSGSTGSKKRRKATPSRRAPQPNRIAASEL